MTSPWDPGRRTLTRAAAVGFLGLPVVAYPTTGTAVAYAVPNAAGVSKVLLLDSTGTSVLQQSAPGVLSGSFTGLAADTPYQVCSVGPGGPGPRTAVSTWVPTATGALTAPTLLPTLSFAAGLMFQDLARTVPAAVGSPVRVVGCPFLRGSLGAGGDWALSSGNAPTLRSDGFRYWLDADATPTFAAGSGMTGGAYTVGIAARPVAASGNTQVSSNAGNLFNLAMGSNVGYYYSGGWQGAGSPPDVTDTLVWKFSGSTGTVYRNGSQVFSGTWTSGTVSGWLFGGNGAGRALLTYGFLGLAAALSDAVRAKLEQFLAYFYKPVGG